MFFQYIFANGLEQGWCSLHRWRRKHILKFGRQGGIHTTQHPVFPMGPARLQFSLCPVDGAHSKVTVGPASELPVSYAAAGQRCQVVISFLNRKRQPGPFFLLGTLEVSPPIYLTPISLPTASKDRVGEEPPSQFSCPEGAEHKVRGCRKGKTRGEREKILQVRKEGKCQGPNTKFITF